MKEITITAPIKTPSDIEEFTKNSRCRRFYVYHKRFMDNNFEYINDFIKEAKKCNAKIFVNFKHNITEENIPEIKKFITFLKTTQIDGIFINSFAILELIKAEDLPFKIIIDSYFEIHNLAGIDFVNNFHKIDTLIITEEIYMKNISKIKKYTKLKLAVDSDNLPWCAEDLIKSKSIDSVIIKGKFPTSKDILDGILLIEKILEHSKIFRNQALPFKHVRKSFYQTNHFSGEMLSAEGSNFKFSRNIQLFNWKYKHPIIDDDTKYKKLKLPKINLRMTSLAQLKTLSKLIEKLGFNPVYSIEYGEILSTADLAKRSFSKVITKVKKFCYDYEIKFQLSTPRILIERDFDRVFEYVKNICMLQPKPDTIVINNIGYLWAVINDDDLSNFKIEIGDGINLLNSMSIKCLNNLQQIETIDFSNFKSFEDIKLTIKKIKNIIPNKKLVIAGNVRVPSQGLCPLNNDSAIVSRLSCKAPCHKGEFALKDPSLNKIFPFVPDGFCRMHMFKDEILHLYADIDKYKEIGINEFVIDLSSLPPKFVTILITNLLNSVAKNGVSVEYNNCTDY